MKQIKHKSFMSYLYCALMCLPFISILSRILYVQWNKNAYQSYSDNTAQTDFINTTTDFNYNIEYYLINARVTTQTDIGNAGSNRLYLTSFEIIDNSTNLNLNNVSSIGFYRSGNYLLNYFYDNTNTLIGSSDSYYKAKVTVANFLSGFNDVITNNNILYTINGANTLDNVFDYSLNKFVEDNNFGQFDITGFISNMFLPSNAVNNLYIHFINWYMNYAIFTSVVYLMFAVLMWFVNFSRRLLDRGMNYDF